jgi:hypothetical protein
LKGIYLSKISKKDLHEAQFCVRDRDHFYQLIAMSNRLFGHGNWRTQRHTLYKLELGYKNLDRKWFVPDPTAIPMLKLL